MSRVPLPAVLRLPVVLMTILLMAFVAACGESAARVRIEALGPSVAKPVLPGQSVAGGTPGSTALSPTPSASPASPAPLALLVSFTFPLDDISLAQAHSLVDGSVSRWSEVGGPDLPVRRITASGGTVTAVNMLDAHSATLDDAAQTALAAAAAQQPGTLALVVWDGPRLRSKGLSVDGHRPDEPGYPLKSDIFAQANGPGQFTLAAAGDLMLGRRVAQLAGPSVGYPLAQVAPDFSSADLGFANLEVALTQRGDAAHKDYTFRAPTDLAVGLRQAGINVVSVANNHVLDYGPIGLDDTLAALDTAGVSHAGAGDDAAAAGAPAIVEVHGTRVAFLSFVNVPNDSVTGFVAQSMEALPGRAGVNWGTPEAVTREVLAAKQRADVVIVSMHVGIEYADEPNDIQRALAHAAIDAGAALVIGAHPHVLQGIEYYRNAVILYSLGNFVFDLDNADVLHYGLPAAQTVVARVTFSGGHVQGLELLPAVIDTSQYRPVPAAGAAAQQVLERVYRLTDQLAAEQSAVRPAGQEPTSRPAPPTPGN